MGLHALTMTLGFAGGLAVLASFAGVAMGRLRADDATYHAMNLGGAAALVVSGLAASAWPSVAVNVVWALISAAGLARSGCARIAPEERRTGRRELRRFRTAFR